MRNSELVKVRAMLKQLGIAPPDLIAYIPINDKKYEWEGKIERFIEKLDG